MSKRFTDTNKWQEDWHHDLTPVLKCLWSYLCDHCDGAGVWEGNWRLASFQIGETVSVKSLEAFGARVEVLPNGKVWLVDHVEFQCGQLSPKCPPHIAVLRLLEKHDLTQRLSHLIKEESKGLIKGRSTLEDKDKDKDEDKEKEPEGGQGETVPTDPRRDLSVDELEAVVQRCFDSPRRLDPDARAMLQQADLVKVSQAAELERFYAAPPDPDNPAMARCKSPGGLVRKLGDQLVKARDFCRRHRPAESSTKTTSMPPPTPGQFAAWQASLPPLAEWREFASFDELPSAKRGECRHWCKRHPAAV